MGNHGRERGVTKPGMTDEQRPTAAYYRNTAEHLRELAANAQLPEVKRELLDLAAHFDRLAEYLEKTDPFGRGRRAP